MENLRVDEDGRLWLAQGSSETPRFRYFSDFTVDGDHASLKLETYKESEFEKWYATEIKYVKTSDGWRIAPSEYYTNYFLITDESSPDTGDGTAARAAVFAAGAVLAAVVPALILTAKRRREEN